MQTSTNEVDRNVQILRDWYQKVWNEKDPSFIDQHYAADGKAYGLGAQYVEGPEPFKAWQKALVGMFPDLRIELQHCFGFEDKVAVHFRATMTYQGREVELRGGGVTRLVDGKIVEAWNLVDFLELLEQMGNVPAGLFHRVLQGEPLKVEAG